MQCRATPLRPQALPSRSLVTTAARTSSLTFGGPQIRILIERYADQFLNDALRGIYAASVLVVAHRNSLRHRTIPRWLVRPVCVGICCTSGQDTSRYNRGQRGLVWLSGLQVSLDCRNGLIVCIELREIANMLGLSSRQFHLHICLPSSTNSQKAVHANRIPCTIRVLAVGELKHCSSLRHSPTHHRLGKSLGR
jgi:hypothetical protein